MLDKPELDKVREALCAYPEIVSYPSNRNLNSTEVHRIMEAISPTVLALIAEARAARLAYEITKSAPELNMSNYDHEQVAELNSTMFEAYAVLQAVYATLTKDKP